MKLSSVIGRAKAGLRLWKSATWKFVCRGLPVYFKELRREECPTVFIQISFLFLFPPSWCSIFFLYHFLSTFRADLLTMNFSSFSFIWEYYFHPQKIFSEFCIDSSFLSTFKKYFTYFWPPWFLMRCFQSLRQLPIHLQNLDQVLFLIQIMLILWAPSLPAPLEKAMASHSSTLAWKIPWMEEPGRLKSMGSLRVRHD